VSSADYLEIIPEINGYLSEMEKLWSSLRLHYKELLIVAPSRRGHCSDAGSYMLPAQVTGK
jgi:hypothetical protein